MGFALARYLQQFPDICSEKFGKTYEFKHLEERFLSHRTGKRLLTAKDIARIFSPDNTPFGIYWPRPSAKVLEEQLSSKRIYVGPLTKEVRPLILRLLGVFHNIGTVSLLLRFVHPSRFGIFSTPVIHLVQVSRPNTVDLYLAYCDELARWKEHFRMASVAETEMALWTYAELVKKAESDPTAAAAASEFDQDIWVQRQRVAQVLRPFLRRYGRLQLAEVLLDEDPILAGKIAAEEYERLLGVASRRLFARSLLRGKGAAEALIDSLAENGHIRLEDKSELKRIWETRNKVVHPGGKRAEREEVAVMIDCISRLCEGWEKHQPEIKEAW